MTAQQTRTCTRCKKEFSLYSERCPHCGKDSVIGTQALGVLVTIGLLMLTPLVILFLIWFLY